MPEETPRDTPHVDLPPETVPGKIPVVMVGPEGQHTVWLSLEEAVALMRKSKADLWLIARTSDAESSGHP